MFYDALAGQGDFFQNGVLSPPFTPLIEVNFPPPMPTLAVREPAARGRRPAEPVSRRR